MKNVIKYPYILIGILCVNIVFSIFSFTLRLADYQVYSSLSFAIIIFNIVLIGLVSIIEAASLKFDRTASKQTLFATLCLLASYFFSNDFLFAYTFAGNSVSEIVPRIFIIIHQAFYFGFVYFLFTFIQNDYHLESYSKIHLVSLSLGVVLTAIFSLTNIFIGLVVVSILEFLYISFFLFWYLFKLQRKENVTAALISLVMMLAPAFSLPINVFFLKEPYLLGIPTLLFIIPAIGYLLIYFDFIIKKTKATYEYEDKKKIEDEKKSHKMVVKCFHSFSVKYDDVELIFPSKKSKEFFALLVILRGSPLTLDKAITYLWPDKDVDKAKGLYRNTIMKLRDYFSEIKCNIITFKRGETYLDTTIIDCDYYDAFDHKDSYNNNPLMPEYDWSFEFENNL